MKLGTSFKYSNPYAKKRKENKPKTLNQMRCRKCKLPKKAAYSSSIRLSCFEIDYYSETGLHLEYSDTQESKELFELVRKSTFCQCVKKKPNVLRQQLEELIREKLGDNPSKNARRKFIRYGKVPNVRKH